MSLWSNEAALRRLRPRIAGVNGAEELMLQLPTISIVGLIPIQMLF